MVFENELAVDEIDTLDSRDISTETFGVKLLDENRDELVLNHRLVEAIGSEAFQQLANLGGHNLGSVGNVEENHEI